MNYDTGIYAPGPIKPVVKIRENLSVWTGGAWEHFRADYIEPMPRSPAMEVEMVVASAATTLAAGGTIAKRVVAILQLSELDLFHLRWEPIDNVEGVLWEKSGQGKFLSRNVHARVDKATKLYDPYLATTTFWILGRDRDMNLEVRNPMGYATPTARFAFWGYRYVLVTAIPADVSDQEKKALWLGELDAVKRIIGPTTWLPAEGRV